MAKTEMDGLFEKELGSNGSKGGECSKQRHLDEKNRLSDPTFEWDKLEEEEDSTKAYLASIYKEFQRIYWLENVSFM